MWSWNLREYFFLCWSVQMNSKQATSMYVRAHTHTNTQSNTSLAAFHDSTLNYSELRCSAAKAQSTPRQLGSRKQYKIDMHVPLCFSEVCGAPRMPGGVALLTQASLPHCNTGSLIRYNKRGNEVRQQEEKHWGRPLRGKADPSQGSHAERCFILIKIMSEQVSSHGDRRK